MLPELENDLKYKNEYLLEVLHDTLELMTLISGNLECVLEIRKRLKNCSRKETRTLKKNFRIFEDLMQLMRNIIKKSAEISYDFVKPIPPKEVKKDKQKPLNNIIIFPLEQEDDDIYVAPGETIFDRIKKDEKKDDE